MLAGLYIKQGKYDQAADLLPEALAGYRRMYGDEHPSVVGTKRNLEMVRSGERLYETKALLAVKLAKEGRKPKEAEALFREALEGFRRTLGPDDSSTLMAAYNLAAVVGEQGKVDEAEALYRETIAGLRRAFGPDHPHIRTTLGNLALLVGLQASRPTY